MWKALYTDLSIAQWKTLFTKTHVHKYADISSNGYSKFENNFYIIGASHNAIVWL